MKRMLRRIGCDAIADNLLLLSPPLTVSIARAAREAGNGFELVFFQTLQEEIDDLRARGAEEFHFTELRESAQILRGAPRWNRSCELLHQEILAFLQNFAQQPIPDRRRIHLTIEL